MKTSGLFLLGFLAVAGQAPGQDCCPKYTIQYVDKPVTCTKMEWRTRDVAHAVMKPVYREVVKKVDRDVVVPEWRDEHRDCVNYVLKPREVLRDHVTCMLVPATAIDPCTGCEYKTYKPQPMVQKVKCTVYDCVPETTRVPVKVCHYRTEKRSFEYKETHCDWVQEMQTKKEWYCVPVTYTTTVKVPVCVPCP